MAKAISQDTFNDVVKENIEDFDMTREEAIDDAVKQFEAQLQCYFSFVRSKLEYASIVLHLSIIADHELYRKGPGTKIEKMLSPDALAHPASAKIILIHEAHSQQDTDDLASRMNIFTDGSKLEGGKVGAGCIVFKEDGQIEKHRMKLADHCSVYQAELLAIKDVMCWLHKRSHPVSTTIYLESHAALQTIQQANPTHPLANVAQRLLFEARERADVKLVWVKAHIGIIGNELADKTSNEATENKKTGYASFGREIS